MTDTEFLDHFLELDSVGMLKALMANPSLASLLAKSLRETRAINKTLQKIIDNQSYNPTEYELIDEHFNSLLENLNVTCPRCDHHIHNVSVAEKLIELLTRKSG